MLNRAIGRAWQITRPNLCTCNSPSIILKGLNFFTCKPIPNSSTHLVPAVVSYCTAGDLSLTPAMELSQLVSQLNKFASPSLAESWDNVGLLVEPSAPHEVKTLLLTNDLTPSVLDEAIRCDANMILSYHPPIFSPLKRLNQKNWKERLIVKCIENRIAVYSPHTSYDAVQDGVNDWLIQAFDLEDVSPIISTQTMPDKYNRKLLFTAEQFLVEPLQSVLSSVDDIMVSYININESTSQISVLCWADAIPVIMSCIQALSDKILSTEVYDLQKIPKTGHGMGRKGTLVEPISLEEAVQRVKTHLGLEHVRLAKKNGNKKIKTVAVCAGSGGQLLRNVPVSLYVTGEMSHHDVLHAQQSGSNVILCDHSNTERGFLKVLKEKFDELFDRNLNIIVSKIDRDPLEVV